MMKAFNLFDNVAWVGPVCGSNAVTTMQASRPEDMEPIEVSGHLSGYCFLTKKSIYDELGYFDEDFCFYGQESDWIDRVFEINKYQKKDYKITIAPRAHVVHGYDGEGSQAAKQAEQEEHMDTGEDSQYSYLCWNFKKMRRLEKYDVKYEFPEYNGYGE